MLTQALKILDSLGATHWALGVGEEAIARSHPTLYSPGRPIRHWRLGIG
ncbi:hypothetical protein [Nostoc sp. CALU 546]